MASTRAILVSGEASDMMTGVGALRNTGEFNGHSITIPRTITIAFSVSARDRHDRACADGRAASGHRRDEAGVSSSAAAADRKPGAGRSRPRSVLRSAALRVGQDRVRSCHFAELGWGVTDARSRNDSGKLTSRKSQPLIGIGHAGDAPVGWDGRNATLEAQAKSSIATGSMSMRETPTPGEGRGDRGADPRRTRPTSRSSRRRCRARRSTSIPSSRRSRPSSGRWSPGIAPFDRWIEGDEQAISECGQARLRAVQRQGQLLCLPRRLALHRRQVPRHRHHDHRSGTRPRGQGRRADAVRLQDADAALRRRAPALHAQRLAGDARTTS